MKFNLTYKTIPDPIQNNTWAQDAGQSGSVLIYIVVVMLVFGFLGAAMISMFNSATMMSTGVPNYSKNSMHLAEAGMRYAVSELRNTGYTADTINTLNTTTYTLDGTGSFTLNVLGKWFETLADYDASSGTLTLNTPEGQFPSSDISSSDFDIPVGAFVVNLESFRDAIIYSGNVEDYTAEIQGVTYASIHIDHTDSFKVGQDQPICLAVRSASEQHPSAGGVLILPEEAQYFFPEKNGSFYVQSTMDAKQLYYYSTLAEVSGDWQLTGLSDALDVSANDYVILSRRNHIIVASGVSGAASYGGADYYAANFRQNTTAPQDIEPPALDIPEDIDTETTLGGMDTVSESVSGAVDVNVDTGEITLGGGVNSAHGSVFFGGDLSIGGASVCSGGICQFNKGIRVFFILDYNGTGDGITFAVINGSDNSVNSSGGSGGSGELMGYAGGGLDGNGLMAPKMALEFDTYVNSSRDDPNLGSHRDALQYVFWGDSPQSNLNDDNIHDTGGAGEKWSPYVTWDEVRTKPAVNSTNDKIYVNNNGRIYGIDPDDGSSLFSWPYYLYLSGSSSSSPALDSVGSVFMGDDVGSGYINSVKADGSNYNWYHAVNGDVRSSPVIDSNDVVYFGNQSGYFFAYNNTGSPAKWTYYLGSNLDIKCTPDLSPDEATVYFVSEDTNYLYALNTADGTFKWQFDIQGEGRSSPRVAADGTIYVGSDGGDNEGHLFAVNPDGTQKWRYDFSPSNTRSRPAIGLGGTIYVGNDDNYLYAITDDGTQGTLKWRFQTSGDIRSDPMVHTDGTTIWFGSDDSHLYAVDEHGLQVEKFDLKNDVKSAPSQGSDGTVYVGSDYYDSVAGGYHVYAYKPSCYPPNLKDRHFSYDDLSADEKLNVSSSDNWLNSGPWAVRVEIARSEAANAMGKYAYILKSWIRQCADSTCSTISDTHFADTRIDYAAHDPGLVQTAEFCTTDHTKFDTFLYGFTQATGGATQTAVISNVAIGFKRTGDDTITVDDNWP